MINLLPPMTKQTYRYARRNRILVHWITAMAACLIGAVLLVAGGYFYLNQQIDSNTKQIAATNRQLNAQDLGKVQKQVATISSNLRLAVQVLSKEILFSELLKQLAKVTPDNVVLTNLTIEQAQGGVDITAQTADYNAATQLQVNLA
ncbi:MAG TPA: PilN domain-containing protein, partial [Candidatus Saccharimonadales bacterium]|nr:PilN domain-containing protein [Candidatus Saccharimonadales bacterium]